MLGPRTSNFQMKNFKPQDTGPNAVRSELIYQRIGINFILISQKIPHKTSVKEPVEVSNNNAKPIADNMTKSDNSNSKVIMKTFLSA